MLFIRADANSKIGSGHVMRCLAIAKELRHIGQEITFVTADHEPDVIIKNSNFNKICLESDWNKMEEELPVFTELIAKEEVQAVIVDSYNVTERYLRELRRLTKIVLMDDLNQQVFPADIIINYNIYANQLAYATDYPIDKMLLLGCRYVPLREEFIGRKKENCSTATNIMITTGGADAFNIAGQLIIMIRSNRKFNDLILHIVAGPLNKNIDELEHMVRKYSNILLHRNVSNMSELMLQCDIAVSAGGSTLYELCACGIPTISFSYADNQLQSVKEFHRLELIYYAGDMRYEPKLSLENISLGLDELCKNTLCRETLSIKMQALVDGYGAHRITEKLLTI